MAAPDVSDASARNAPSLLSLVKIRPARHSDIPAIAHLCAAAFMDDSLKGEVMNPYRDKYPHDVYLGHLREMRIKFWDYGGVIDVAVLPSGEQAVDDFVQKRMSSSGEEHRNDVLSKMDRQRINDVARVTTAGSAGGKSEIIVGVGQWSRYGDSEVARAGFPDRWDPRILLKPLTTSVMKIHARVWPNRASSPVDSDIMARSVPFWIPLCVADPLRAECWFLGTCAVHPVFQGCGIGKSIVEVGKKRADKDKVCAVLTSAEGKDGFYQRACGFEEQYGDMCAGGGNPLSVVSGRGGLMYWYWPEGVKRPAA